MQSLRDKRNNTVNEKDVCSLRANPRNPPPLSSPVECTFLQQNPESRSATPGLREDAEGFTLTNPCPQGALLASKRPRPAARHRKRKGRNPPTGPVARGLTNSSANQGADKTGCAAAGPSLTQNPAASSCSGSSDAGNRGLGLCSGHSRPGWPSGCPEPSVGAQPSLTAGWRLVLLRGHPPSQTAAERLGRLSWSFHLSNEAAASLEASLLILSPLKLSVLAITPGAGTRGCYSGTGRQRHAHSGVSDPRSPVLLSLCQ